MLLEFSCSNYKAIKEKIVFTMVAGSDKSHQEELYEFDDYRVSRITSVYGANGAGKSTLIDAVGYLGFLVRECVKFQEGDKIPRKGGPGITRSDLLVINKIDLAPYVGASLEVMERDSRKMRGERPFVFTNIRGDENVDTVVEWIKKNVLLEGL